MYKILERVYLEKSGDLSNIPMLHDTLFECEVYDGNKWASTEGLTIFSNTAFLNNEKLYNVSFNDVTNNLVYSFGKYEDHRAGSLFFTDDKLAFIGTIYDETNKSVRMRGKIRQI
ncbi:hypothetical protein GH866_30005 [Bacillus thuringiensis]|nr:hypothetical protein [Bacillus thuringiensis]